MSDSKECCGPLFCGINKPKNFDNLTDLEKKHIPVIKAPQKIKAGECFEITVEVGNYLSHPNENGHFIEFIELYAGDNYLARLDFTACRTCPTLKLCINFEKNLGPLRALTRCNLHGVWESSLPIEVIK